MDLWNKIFSSKNKDKFCTESNLIDLISISSTSSKEQLPLRFHGDQVRVLLYRECDVRGRKLLYDSLTVTRTPIDDKSFQSPFRSRQFTQPKSSSSSQPSFSSSTADRISATSIVSDHKPPSSAVPLVKSRSRRDVLHGGVSYVEIKDGFGYQYHKESSDSKQIAELIFGAVALAYKGSSAKMHLLKEPSRLLFSRTSRAPRVNKSLNNCGNTTIEDSFTSTCSDSGDFQMVRQESALLNSKSSLWPSVPYEMASSNRPSISEEDSGFSGPPSPFSSTCGSYLTQSLNSHPGTPTSRNGSGSNLKNSGSFSSLQRRFLRTITTSLDSIGFCSGGEDDQSVIEDPKVPPYRTKLGLGIVITTKQHDELSENRLKKCLFDHQEVLEASINKLQFSMESAYQQRSTFVSYVFGSVSQFKQELVDLFCAPRLPSPIWLSLLKAETSDEKQKLHSKLTESLSCLLYNYDTKQTNFFVSKLLTGILTYHLGWVTTVAPNISPGILKNDEAKSNFNLVNFLSTAQPYNALWSQLCELTGAIGYPFRSTKTVIVGKDAKLLNHILVVLSYLIRCSIVEENEFVNEKNVSNRTSNVSLKAESHSKDSFSSGSNVLSSDSYLPVYHSESATNRSTGNNLGPSKSKSSSQTIPEGKNSKWMLFDEEDIVINRINSDSKLSCQMPITPAGPTKIMQTSKTMGNLASLNLSESSSSSENLSSFKSNLHPNFHQFPKKLVAKNTNLERVENVPKHQSFTEPVTVGGENIVAELEKGGKVLFLLGENQKLEDLKFSKQCKDTENSNQASPLSNTANIEEEPTFLNVPRLDKCRYQFDGTTSGSQFNILQSNIYSSSMNLKKKSLSLSIFPNISGHGVKYHQRSLSDPLHGASLNNLFPYKNHLKVQTNKLNCSNSSVQTANINQLSTNGQERNASFEEIDIPIVETLDSPTSLKTAESLLGGIVDHYSSIFVLHATTHSEKLEDLLRLDLVSASQKPTIDSNVSEAVAIVAEINSWEIELVSSHSFSVDRRPASCSAISYGGVPIMMSPLVSEISDSLFNLIKIGTPSSLLVRCFESHLRKVYLKSELLAEYLLEGTDLTTGSSSSKPYLRGQTLYDLPELTRNLCIDLNDLPLLLSVASTHTPALTQMFGLTFK